MATTGQTINDRINAVRYALVGQGLARTVCKATTEEVLGPKKKHIDYLLACTNEPNVSIPQMANLLIERTQHTSWAVVFKSLISIHHLMSYGNERFTQYLATSNHSFELSDFMDRTTPQGYNMSTFVRRYAKYINDKSISYRTLAIDLCKIGRGNDNALRTMNMENLSKTLPIVHQQFDSLLDFAATSKDLNNSVIMSAFRLLYKDLNRLYVAYQEAIINLLERYFKLSRKKTREALEMYRKYLAKMDKVAAFLQVVDAVGLDKSEMPDLTKSPASILEAMETWLASLEAKKRGTTPVSPGEDDDVDTNKEDREQSTSQQETKEVPKTSTTNDSNEAKESQAGTTSKDETAFQATTEKGIKSATKNPARPSPKASPLVSPSDSKSPPSSSVKPVSPASSSSAPAAEKKGPPERPAKPPSRPPPPSAAQTPSAPPPPPPGGPSAPASSATSTKVASHASPPPPHPPPPQAHHHQPPPHPPAPHAPPHPPAPSTSPAQTSSPTMPATRETDLNNTTSNSAGINSHGNNNSSNSDKEHENAPAVGPPTCSASAVTSQTNDSTVEQQVRQLQIGDQQAVNHEDMSAIGNEVGTNHVNNVSQETIQREANVGVAAAVVEEEEEELEMPSPPPPIDDIDDSMPEPPPPIDEAEEALSVANEEQPQQEQQQQADGSQPQPVLNGQPTNVAQ